MKNNMSLLLFTCFTISLFKAGAQHVEENSGVETYEQAFIGAGLGLDYGGAGVRVEFLPAKCIGLFAGAGYNFVDPGINAGASLKLAPGKKITPTAIIMYGYNAAIRIRNSDSGNDLHRKSYSGFSAGVGLDARVGRTQQNKFSFILFVPFRTEYFHRDFNALKEEGYEFSSKPLPFALSVGYCFGIADRLRRSTHH